MPTELIVPRFELDIQEGLGGFESQQWKSIEASIDLFAAVKRESAFLKYINQRHPELYEDRMIKNAIRRYEEIWLPFAAETERNAALVPPIDVHFIWHTHMLNPVEYIADCKRIVGKVIDHKSMDINDMLAKQTKSMDAWTKRFPLEPYDYTKSSPAQGKPYERKSDYDIFSAVQRQRNFNYQISLPHYSSTVFLEDAVVRYQKFLYLKMINPESNLSPAYDIDLVWHTHQVHPIAYLNDMERLLGYLFDHNDSLTVRSGDSVLRKNESTTKNLWARQYGGTDSFWRHGCMYRGHLHPATLDLADDQPDIQSLPRLKMQLRDISVSGLKDVREELKFKLKLSHGIHPAVFRMKAAWPEWSSTGMVTLSNNENEESLKAVEAKLKDVSGDVACKLKLFNHGALNLRKDILQLTSACSVKDLLPVTPYELAYGKTTKLDFVGHDPTGLAILSIPKVTLLTSVQTKREFHIQEGQFQSDTLDADSPLLKFCQAAALNKSNAVAGAPIHISFHDVASSDEEQGKTEYRVTVVHSAPMLLSMVLVGNIDGRIFSMAHMIGPESLPLEDQLMESGLESTCPTLTSPIERAMVVSNRRGDSAIIVGKWSGFCKKTLMGSQRGSATSTSSGSSLSIDEQGRRYSFGSLKPPFKKAKPGMFDFAYFDLIHQQRHNGQLPKQGGSTAFQVKNLFEADLKSHKIETIGVLDVADQLASIFSISVLFNMCNPDKIRSRGENCGAAFPCHEWALLRAAGYGQPSPALRHLAVEREKHGGGDPNRIFVSSEVDSGAWALLTIDDAELIFGDDFATCAACGNGTSDNHFEVAGGKAEEVVLHSNSSDAA